MIGFAIALLLAPLVIGAYSYVGYPCVLWALTRFRSRRIEASAPAEWPTVTVTVPVYNSGRNIRRTLERLMALDYPRELLQILVLSDASTDDTDDIVREFAPQGVELLRAPERRGKTAAENAAVGHARGQIIVNVDSTVEVPSGSLKPLVAALADPTVGVASGRDVSVGSPAAAGADGEGGYTGFEMRLRDLETRAGSIVGASGCFFAIRREIHDQPLPPALSWDFASALVARRKGYRSVSVPAAICLVPVTGEMRSELRRKSRTMARGLSTLFYFRELLNPFRYGGFALMLISHKLLRWLPYLLLPVALLGLTILSVRGGVAAIALGLVAAAGVTGIVALRLKGGKIPKPIALAGFAVAVGVAGFLAWYDALRGDQKITWNPTPRPGVSTA